MDKKAYLQTVLTQLEPRWNLAKWLKFLVEQWNLDDNILEIIIQSIEWAIDNTKDDHDFVELKKTIK